MAGGNLLDYSPVFALLVFINAVGIVYARKGLIGRYFNYVKVIDCQKLLLLCNGRTRHAGELGVKTEVVLEGDGGEGFALVLNVNVFFRLDRLMQTLAVTSAEHKSARKFVNNCDLTVLNNIVNVTLHYAMRLDSLVYVV